MVIIKVILSSTASRLTPLIINSSLGPVRELLSSKPLDRLRGLDVGCSTAWAEEMAQEFPHVQWYGIDTRPSFRPHPNTPVSYKFYDYTRGFLFEDGYFDVIHARNTFSMVLPLTPMWDLLTFSLFFFIFLTRYRITVLFSLKYGGYWNRVGCYCGPTPNRISS